MLIISILIPRNKSSTKKMIPCYMASNLSQERYIFSTLSRDIHVAQKTAWYMLQKIRRWFICRNKGILKNKIEIDETFVGGKNKNRTWGEVVLFVLIVVVVLVIYILNKVNRLERRQLDFLIKRNNKKKDKEDFWTSCLKGHEIYHYFKYRSYLILVI